MATAQHETKVQHFIPATARQMRIGADQAQAALAHLPSIGVNISQAMVRQMQSQIASFAQDQASMCSIGMDAIPQLLTTAGIASPVQFLQSFLPGLVETITQVRNIDLVAGISIMGDWAGEEVIQGMIEPTGKARPYGDITGLPLASWNIQWERRTIIRFENGIKVGKLEQARTSMLNVDTAAWKREGASQSLEVARNLVGFYGYNGGANRTYGFLNDPSLPAYVTVANPGSGTQWSVKTMLQIIADIREAVGALITQSGANIDPSKIDTTLVLPSAVVPFLGVTSDFGYSVSKFMADTYPLMRVVTAPELTAANGGSNVFYLFADTIDGSGNDDRRTFVQIVPTKFQVLGVENKVKGYEEGYTNATAGVICKRPFAVVRRSGI